MTEYRLFDRVEWNSAAGLLSGTIVNILLSPNAAGDIVPWLDLETDLTTIRLCATTGNLKAMQVRHELETV